MENRNQQDGANKSVKQIEIHCLSDHIIGLSQINLVSAKGKI